MYADPRVLSKDGTSGIGHPTQPERKRGTTGVGERIGRENGAADELGTGGGRRLLR